MPGDLHKLWRSRDPKQYHVEYGYSCMGYEIAGGLGVKMADPEREVYVMVGDGSYLMMAQEIATSVQERRKLIVVLVDNAGYKSIGALSRSKGTAGFGTRDLMREDDSAGDDATHAGAPPVPVDLALNAEGLGAHVIRALTIEQLRDALVGARAVERTVVVHVPVDRYESVPDYESWWDVPVAEVSEMEAVREARVAYEGDRRNERWWL
jgi:3D-(3,5/4)-trihydroxycyclohexane-1,2-dione acylhydrolase (decyclizing)